MDPETDTTSNYDDFDHNDHLIGTLIGARWSGQWQNSVFRLEKSKSDFTKISQRFCLIFVLMSNLCNKSAN